MPARFAAQALPNLAVPAQWAAKGGAAGSVANSWLAAFNDQQLTALVLEAIQYNPDLRVAAARVEQAAGYARLAGATLYPQVSIMGRGGGEMSGDSSGLQGIGIFASWELDLWGRVRAGRESAQLQYVSVELDTEYARQSIAALVAKSWFLATESRLQKGIAEEMVRSGERLVSLARDRLRVGKGDEYDVTHRASKLAELSRRRAAAGSLVPAGAARARDAGRALSGCGSRSAGPACREAGADTGRHAFRTARAPARRGGGGAARGGCVLPGRGSQGGAFTDNLAGRERHQRIERSVGASEPQQPGMGRWA